MLITLLVVTSATLLATFLLGKTYKATTTLLLNYKGIDSISGAALPAQLMPSYIATQIDIIYSKRVALGVVDALRLPDRDSVRKEFYAATGGKGDIREWLAAALKKKLDAHASHESGVLELSFKGADPQFAAEVANAFASEYRRTTVDLKAEPLQAASEYFKGQIKALRDNLESVQKRLTGYQENMEIIVSDPRADIETARLNALSSELVAVQGKLMEASSRERQAQRDKAGESPDVIGSPLIQNLRALLAQAEARTAQLGESLMPEHPTYQRAKAEVDVLRSQLIAATKAVSNSIGNNSRIWQRREMELSAALEEQKGKVLKVNRARDDLAILGKEVDSARQAYDAAVQRFNQNTLEAQARHTDVSLLTAATAPSKASNFSIGFNLMISLALGTMLGIALALIAELRDRRIRCATDMIELIQAPVFGEVSFTIQRDRRLAFPRLPLLGR
jgi:succinoglycan biosynthesis transport protein ExoP